MHRMMTIILLLTMGWSTPVLAGETTIACPQKYSFDQRNELALAWVELWAGLEAISLSS